jgi:hypothetical protein
MMGEEIEQGFTINNLQLEDQTNLTLEEIGKRLCLKFDVAFALLTAIYPHMVAMLNELNNILGLDELNNLMGLEAHWIRNRAN